MAATTTEIEPVREIALPGSTPTENGETVDSKSHPPGLTLFDGIEDSNDASTAEDQYPTGAKFYTICLSLGLVIILGALDATIVATAVPSITDHFHTIADVGWYLVAYKLPECALQFFFGKLYKIFSTKRIMLASTAIFIFGSILCATAVSSKMFVFARAVTGLGSTGVIAGCFVLLVHIMPLRKRPLFTGLFGALEGVATMTAPILGGVLTQRLSWRWCFCISVPIGAIVLITMAIFLSDPRESGGRNMSWREIVSELDVLGTLVFVPGITSLFLALSWAGTKYPWNSPVIIGLLVGFVVLTAVFAWDQHRKQDAATLPPRIIKRRSIIAAFIFSLCCNGGVGVVEYYMPTYFQSVREYSPARSGYMMIPTLAGFMIGVLVSGAGTSLFGYFTPFMLFASILAPVAVGLMTTWSLETSLGELIAYSGLAGFAGAIGYQGPQSAVQATLPDSDASLGLSVVLFSQYFGMALFVSIAQTIFTNRLAANLQGLVPGLDASSIEQMGLSDLKALVGPQNLEKALLGVDRSLVQTWYLPLGLMCMTMVGSLLMEWRSVKQKKS